MSMGTPSSAPQASLSSLPQQAANGRLMDHRRRNQMVEGGPQDHTGEVVESPMADFDINKTIFKTLASTMQNPAQEIAKIKKQYAIQLEFSKGAVDRIDARTGEMLTSKGSQWASLKSHSPALISFMENDCDFAIEHADGSFLDHLQFCYEYCHVHFPGSSPTVLFLHSIMGVGTNLFPMKLEQRPQLAELVSADELAHIEAFPSFLRLLQTDLADHLEAMTDEQLQQIDGLEFCRLLGPEMHTLMKSDNAALHLTAEQFWVHLNYQIIHFLDFLPADSWDKKVASGGLFLALVKVHKVLVRAGKLMANIKFDSAAWAETVQRTETPEKKQSQAKSKMMTQQFSDKIGHSLEYTVKKKLVARL